MHYLRYMSESSEKLAAAACYAFPVPGLVSRFWPHNREEWEPSADKVENLRKARDLIDEEMRRLEAAPEPELAWEKLRQDRAQAQEEGGADA